MTHWAKYGTVSYMKTCTKCKDEKPFSEFYFKDKAKTKYRSWCKPCISDNRRESEHLTQKSREYSRNRYHQNPEARAKTLENAKSRALVKRREDPHGRYRYRKAHEIVIESKGRAREHSCNTCGSPALDWAMLHEAKNKESSLHYEWSDNPDDYIPMCRSCHKIYDLNI